MDFKLTTWLVIGAILLLFNDGVSCWRRRRRRRTPAPAPCDQSPCEWKWDDCSVTCGSGTQKATKTKTEGKCGKCDMPSTSKVCKMGCCPRDCAWNQWSLFMPCSVTCGGGWQLQKRTKAISEECGGTCKGESFKISHCGEACCPKPCVWAPWTHWGRCDHSCGHGIQTRSRHVERPATCGGRECRDSDKDHMVCNIAKCKTGH